MKTTIIITLALCLVSSCICAQAPVDSIRQNESKLSAIATEESTTDWLTIKPNVKIKSNDFFSNYKKTIGFSSNDDFVLVKSDTDNMGLTHDRFQQYHKGVKVDGEIYIVHSKDGIVIRVNGKKRDLTNIDIVPVITESVALKTAFSFINSNKYAWQDSNQINIWVHYKNRRIEDLYPSGELVIVNRNNGFPQKDIDYRLAWKFEIRTAIVRDSRIVYVDADSNIVVNSSPITSSTLLTSDRKFSISNSFNTSDKNISNEFANSNKQFTDSLLSLKASSSSQNCISTTGVTIWHGNQPINTSYSQNHSAYILDENCNNHGDIHTVNFYNAWNAEYTDADNTWTSNNMEGVEAHKNARMTLDFFFNYFNRNSFDNAGSKIYIFNEDSNPDDGFNNATWDGSNGVYLGDGGTGDAYDDYCTIDIVAHEIAHGVTQNTAGLGGSGEPGALNEGFSDIFGTAVERYYLGDCCFDWIIGGERTGGALRDMSTPMTYLGKNWYSGSGDYGGVHTNNGVLNYWFYLIAHGGSGMNDNDYPYNITGIGFNDAIIIVYETLVNLTPNCVYGDARIATLQAAIDKFGKNSKQYSTVEAAWCAVGMGTNCQTSTMTYDEPCDADMLTVGSTCNYVTRTIIGATKSTQVPDASCDQPSNVDVWFKFIIPNEVFSVHTNSISISGNDCGLAIYTGSCSSLTQRFCKNDGNPSQNYMPWVDNLDLTSYAGQTAFIRVWEYGTVSQTGEFQICVSSENTNNGDCNITSLSSSSETHGSSSFSTTPGEDDIIVTGQPNCTFTVTESCSWLTVSPMSGKMNTNSNGTVGQVFINYSLKSNNTGETRVCTFFINGSPITITQTAEEEEDFYISNVSIPSTSIGVNGTVKVSCDQCYSGSKTKSELGSIKVGYYLSKNSLFDSNDIQLEYDLSNIGNDGPCDSESETITIPGNTMPGLYYILFVADSDESFDESDEENNTEAIQITVNSASHDYYTLNEAVYPNKFLVSELVTFKCDFCYSGSSLDSEIKSCCFAYYFSSDRNFDLSEDARIGSYTTGMGSDDPIKINRTYSHATIPQGTPPGNYYIIFIADEDDRFVETDENNNIKFVPITVVSDLLAEDYYIQEYSISSSSVNAGDTIEAACIQSYVGLILDENISSSYVGYYLSRDNTFSSIDDIKLGTDGSGLGGDDPFESESESLIIPDSIPTGKYCLLFVADYDNRFKESNEENNICFVEINIENITGIINAYESENISIYPNPTTGKIDISGFEFIRGKFKVDVMDFMGKTISTYVYKSSTNTVSIDISDYPKGVYLIRLSNTDVTYQKKVIKN